MEVEKIHQRAEKVLQAEAINPDDFSRYDRAMIASDKEYVRRRKESFERDTTPEAREAKQIADILEAIVLEFGEQGYWFGGGEDEDVATVKTADYDDIKNGADIIVEKYPKDGGVSNLGLAVDVTYREDIDSKIQRIYEEVASGKLTTIRYFYSPRSESRGEQPLVPRVVTGISGEHALDLGRLWMEKKNKQLSEHPVQIIFLEEIQAQLEAFYLLAKSKKQSHAGIALFDALSLINKALKDKEEFIESHRSEIEDYKMNDTVYASIMSKAEDIAFEFKE